MNIIKGQAYILGDDINTDDIVPSHTLTMRDSNEMAKHALEYIDPHFAEKTKKGLVIVAGHNFGTGSSREWSAGPIPSSANPTSAQHVTVNTSSVSRIPTSKK